MEIIAHFRTLRYAPATYFAYDAAAEIINYDEGRLDCSVGQLCLLHETAHALLGHLNYSCDLELYLMEIAAWQKTIRLARRFEVPIDQAYIDDCLASYEIWLSQRATCPDCGNFCLNKTEISFACFVCGCAWRVNDRKDCAVRRRRLITSK